MKKSIDYGRDDHASDDPERAQLAWSVGVLDDCEECDDLRVEVVLEEVGRPGQGMVAHLSPSTARQLRRAMANALREIGESAD